MWDKCVRGAWLEISYLLLAWSRPRSTDMATRWGVVWMIGAPLVYRGVYTVASVAKSINLDSIITQVEPLQGTVDRRRYLVYHIFVDGRKDTLSAIKHDHGHQVAKGSDDKIRLSPPNTYNDTAVNGQKHCDLGDRISPIYPCSEMVT